MKTGTIVAAFDTEQAVKKSALGPEGARLESQDELTMTPLCGSFKLHLHAFPWKRRDWWHPPQRSGGV